MQNAVVDHGWLVDAVSYFYIYGHWPVLAITLLWLMIRHRHEYTRFRNALLISGAIGHGDLRGPSGRSHHPDS